MNILITGAAGFVGGYLAAELRQRFGGAALFGLGRTAAALVPLQSSHDVTPVTVDLLDPEATKEAVRSVRPSQVFHLAGHSATAGDREEIFRANVQGTTNLMGALAALEQPVRVLIAGTGYVYGACDPEMPAAEGDALAPQGDYAESKAEMERVALSETWPERLSVCVARAFNHTGPKQTDRFVVPSLARQIAAAIEGSGQPVRAGNLTPRRDFLDVRDVVGAYRLLMDAPWDRAVVNVCSGAAVSIAEILDLLRELAGVAVEVEIDSARQRAGDLPVVVGDFRRLREWTGWTPRTPLRTTVSDTLDWWRSQARVKAAARDLGHPPS